MHEVNQYVCASTNELEITILFWSLIITILSVFISIIVSICTHQQSARLNFINSFKEEVATEVVKLFSKNFCMDVKDACKYQIVSAREEIKNIRVAFNALPLINIENQISSIMGELYFLKTIAPWRYYRLNRQCKKIHSCIDKMLACAIGSDTEERSTSKKRAAYLKFLFQHRLASFSKNAFKLCKNGI